MTINPIALTIRAKKLGILIRDARQTAGQSVEQVATALGVTPQAFEEYESGQRSPTLPEIEWLAYHLNVPLDHFWGDQTRSAGGNQPKNLDFSRVKTLRQRKIGAMLRSARQEAGLSLETLAERTLSAPALLESYEMGETPIPLPDLEVLCSTLNQPLREFLDRSGPVGAWASEQRMLKDFTELSPELRAFVCKPINQPYLELAVRLSEMSVDRLRAVAEGLLEITL